MGIVYRAYDRERKETVALKLLKQRDAVTLYRFKREFRAIADLAHPNLVPLYELSSVGEDWFFTMLLVDGVDFLQFVRPTQAVPVVAVPESTATGTLITQTQTAGTADTKQVFTGATSKLISGSTPSSGAVPASRPGVRAPPLESHEDFRRLRVALQQLADGVQALHTRGTLHRDIKPSNVLVDANERLMLLDFGVVRGLTEPQSALDSASRYAGTPTYMAPEIGADVVLTEASDWYGIGVMLYEALTGTRPYSGEWRALMQLKRTTDAPPPSTLAPHIPADLDALCCGLLHRDPSRRASGREIRRVCTEGSVAPSPASSSKHFGTVTLVGRDPQLARMRNALSAAQRGVPAAVLVHGASGMGKSMLVQHFCDEVSAKGAVVLSGRCYERESVPYKALDSLMDCLANTLLGLPQPDAQSLLPHDILALAKLFPVLRRVEAVLSVQAPALELADPHEQRRVAVNALRELLDTLSARSTVVLHIDDLQWGDTDSAALLADVLRPPSPPPVLFVASFRDESEQVRLFLERLRASVERWEDVPVRPLSATQARRLATSLLASHGQRPGFADAIAAEAAGSPFFVTELVRHMASQGEEQVVQPELSLDNLLQERLARLSPAARALIDTIAVAGRPIHQGIVLRAVEVEDTFATVTELRQAHLVRTGGSRHDDLIEAYHDRIRETAYALLDPGAQSACHLRLALSLEASGTADAEELGVHFEQGGQNQRAGELYAVAAASAGDQLAFARSGQLYLRSIELLQPRGDRRSELYAKVADAYANAGRGSDAAEAYRLAAEDAPRTTSLRYRGRACEELLRSGHVSEGVASMRDVLTEVGLTVPRSRIGSLLSIAWLRARIRLRGLGYRERDASQITLEALTRIDVCWAASMALGMSDHMLGTALQARHLLGAMRTGDRDHITRALALEAVFTSLGGVKTKRRADKIGLRVLAMAEELGDPLTNVWAHGSRAFALYQRGDWNEGLVAGRAGLAHLRGEAGMWWERTSVNLYVLWCQYWLGHLGELANRVPTLLQDADTRGDLYSYTNFCIGFPAVAWLVRDEPEAWAEVASDAMSRWSRDAYHLQHYWYMIAQCHRHLYVGEPRAALDLVLAEWPLLKKNLMLGVEMVRIESLHLRGRCAIATAQNEPATRAKLIASATRDARALERTRRRHAIALAKMLRAGIASVTDDVATEARLREAETHTEAASMQLYATIAKRYLGRLRGQEGSDSVADAESQLDEQRIVEYDRFSRTFLPGFAEP